MNHGLNKTVEAVAERLGIQKHEVYKAINSVCGYIFDIMEEGSNDGFYMRYLGRFVIKETRLAKMKDKLKEKIDRELKSFEDDPLDLK